MGRHDADLLTDENWQDGTLPCGVADELLAIGKELVVFEDLLRGLARTGSHSGRVIHSYQIKSSANRLVRHCDRICGTMRLAYGE